MDQDWKEPQEQYFPEKKKRRMRLLSTISLIIFMLSIVSFSFMHYFRGVSIVLSSLTTATPTCTVGCGGGGSSSVSCNDNTPENRIADVLPSCILTVVTAPRMLKGQSIDVTVSIVGKKNLSTVLPPTTLIPQSSTNMDMSVPLDRSINDLYGSKYEVFATAQLNGAAFDIAPSGQQPSQALESDVVSFHWSVLPKYSGNQVLETDILLQLKPKAGGNEIDQTFMNAHLSVNVDDVALTFFSLGQFTLGDLLNIFVGAVAGAFATTLNTQVLRNIWKSRTGKRKKQNKPQTRSNTPSQSHKQKRRRP